MILPYIDITIEVSNPSALDDPPLDLVSRALRRGTLLVTEHVTGLWAQIAVKNHIRGQGAYIQGILNGARIEVTQEPNEQGTSFDMEIAITNTCPHASIVEDGHSAFSLVQSIDWGSSKGHIKRGKHGPYLHIPFHHRMFASQEQTKDEGWLPAALRQMMPEAIYNRAKRLTYTQKRHVGPVFNAVGQFVASDRYTWGQGRHRLTQNPGRTGFQQDPSGGLYEERRSQRQVGRDRHGPLVNPEWSSSKFSGMIKGGTKGHSEYMTVRTITPQSKGWNIPAQAGYGIARQVGTMLGQSNDVQELLEQGILEVLEGAV